MSKCYIIQRYEEDVYEEIQSGERGGATPLSRYSKRLDTVSNKNYNSDMKKYSCCSVFHVMLNSIFSVILNLFQDLKIKRFKTKCQMTNSPICHAELVSGFELKSIITFQKFVAFTLAEVLITLAIVGIVAALTIPTLVNNYQKKQTVSKLKQTYSVLSQAISMAQVNRGDMAAYDLGYFYKVSLNDPSFNRKEYLTNFFLNYIHPYVKVSQDYGYKLGTSFGYVRSHYDYYFKLQSGVLVAITFTTGCYNYLPEGGCDSQGAYYGSLVFWVDLNGFDPPNYQGKDIFLIEVLPSTGKLGFFLGSDSNNISRETVLRTCEGAGSVCGYLIMYDGWEIKDDYPRW